jgi:hypothetical protein
MKRRPLNLSEHAFHPSSLIPFSSLFCAAVGDPLDEGKGEGAEQQDVYEAALADQEQDQPHDEQRPRDEPDWQASSLLPAPTC